MMRRMVILRMVLMVGGPLTVVELFERFLWPPVIELETAFSTLKTVWLILNT